MKEILKMPLNRLALFPAPRNFEPTTGSCTLKTKELRCAPDISKIVACFITAAGLDLCALPDEELPSNSLVLGPGQTPKRSLLPEIHAYSMEIAPDHISLCATDIGGLHAGLQSLWQLLAAPSPLPCGRLADAPVLQTRSFQIDLGRQPETLTELKRLLRQQALRHYNECQLYLENSIKLPAFGHAADPDGLTPDEFSELQQFGADLGIDVVPSLNLLGHMEKLFANPQLAHLRETAHGPRHPDQPFSGDICPELPEARALVSRIIDEICATSQSPKLMVGLDECWTLGSHPATRALLDENQGAGPVFARYIQFLHQQVSDRHQRNMWMWDDMLFYHLGAIDQIPRDIGMAIWHYTPIAHTPAYSFRNWRRIDALGELTGRGHPAMLCCCPESAQITTMMRYAEGRPLQGILAVEWEGYDRVQEQLVFKRALAAAVLWTGVEPEYAAVARAVTPAPDDDANQARGSLLLQVENLGDVQSGGQSDTPQFWAWPENLRQLPVREDLYRACAEPAAQYPQWDVQRAFIGRDLVALKTAVARETAALAAQAMLRDGRAESPALNQAIQQVRQACDLARELTETGRALHRRYCSGVRERPMVEQFATLPDKPEKLLRALEVFQQNPGRDTWPFRPACLEIDGIVMDASAHSLAVFISNDGEQFDCIHRAGLRLPTSLRGPFIQSIGLDAPPRYVRLQVGGFASVALTRVRLELPDCTRLPQKYFDAHGEVHHPEHLLEFDRKATLFNAPDTFSNWRSLTPPPVNTVTLLF